MKLRNIREDMNDNRLTHYERTLSKVKNLAECKRWAKIAVNTADPVAAFFNLVEHQVRMAPSEDQGKRVIEHFITETVGYLHAITLEWIAKCPKGFYELTSSTPAFANFLGRLADGEQSSINVGGQMAYQMAWHSKLGKRVYAVTSRLSEMLLQTKLQGLLTDDLKLPERSIYIQVPLDIPLQVNNEDTGWHRLEGIYITEDSESELDCRCWRFLVVGAEKEPLGEYVANDAIAYWRVDLPEGAKLDRVLQQASKQMRIDTKKFDSPFVNMWDEWVKIFEYAMNVVIYATWPDCERENVMANAEARKLWERVQRHPPKSPKRSKAQQAFSKLIPMRRTILDRSVSNNSSRSTGSGQPLLKRVRVHGHWRRYAVGKGRAERKLKWVEPHWRGPLDGEQVERNHRLK